MKAIFRFSIACCLCLAWSAAPAQSQLTPERRAAVERLYSIASKHGPEAVDEHLNTLDAGARIRLESDFWIARREAKEITRSEFVASMLELNERLAPDDWRSIDYWRYVRMLAAKVEKGTMDVEEMQYLAGRRLDEIGRARDEEAAERERALRLEVEADEANRRAAIGHTLRGIGSAFRSRGGSTVCQPLLGGGMQCYPR